MLTTIKYIITLKKGKVMNYINNAIGTLQQICLDCKEYEAERCIKVKCNIGFALNAIKSIEKNGLTVVKDGLQLIPKDDTKYYDKLMVARCIAAICKTCKQCMKGHNENCTVSLARRSIESIALKEIIDYPGDILTYIIKVAEQDQDFAKLIKQEIKLLG
jgi:glutamate mutase epsilon subunit